MTELRNEIIVMPGAHLGDENPLPYFRDPRPDRVVPVDGSLPVAKREGLGHDAGFRVLPYRMQDSYSRQREPRSFQALVLENDYIKATFLPELGGRLISLMDKVEQRELLEHNPVFQPANLAIRNAWFSGGIEWNIGQFGHTFATCSPIFAARIRGLQGEPGLRLYEFERCKRLFWQIDFYLPPASPRLIAYTRVINPNDSATSMYWWTNIAVPEAADVRVLAPAEAAIYVDFASDDATYGWTDLPGLPSLEGADGTYALNSTFANEFFFQCDETDLPWEAALDRSGKGLFEASTGRLRYRKLFCWGTHQGGRRWQEFLAVPGAAYLELQAGLAPTQLHGLAMPAHAIWNWTQVFGSLTADAARVHSPDWTTAWQAVDVAIKRQITLEELGQIEEHSRQQADVPPEVLLSTGAGWGALELRRRAGDPRALPISPAFLFPGETLGAEQQQWLTLLERGRLDDNDPAALPDSWMVQPEWYDLLQASLDNVTARHWHALLHLGVMRLEQFDEDGAASAWQESIRLRPSAWAYRNLAIVALRHNDQFQALAYYRQAFAVLAAAGAQVPALTEEYLRCLCAAGQFTEALAIYEQLPADSRARDRIQLVRGRIALEMGDLASVEQVLEHPFAVIREGETELTDLWFEMWARRVATQTGRARDAALLQQVKRMYPPPAHIDFRMIDVPAS